jgi:hypothetical protein
VAGAKSGDLINTLLGRSTDGGATWSEAQLSTHGSNFRWEAHGARRVGFWGDYIYVSAVPAQSPRCEPTGTTSCPAWTHEPTGPDRFDVYQLCTNVPDDINSASYSPRESPTRMFDLGLLNQSIYIDWSCVRALAPAASRAAGERRSGRSKTPSAAQDNTAAQGHRRQVFMDRRSTCACRKALSHLYSLGADARTRTGNRSITSRVRCQLRHAGDALIVVATDRG